jgi:hypothetical protein
MHASCAPPLAALDPPGGRKAGGPPDANHGADVDPRNSPMTPLCGRHSLDTLCDVMTGNQRDRDVATVLNEQVMVGAKMSSESGSKMGMQMTPSLRRGIEMLSVAYDYAKEVQRDAWEFALEIHCLTAAGVNNSELRWLVCKGLARHAEEKVSPGKKGRVFQNLGDVTFTQGSCFVLTEAGYEAFKDYAARPIALTATGANSDATYGAGPLLPPDRRFHR